MSILQILRSIILGLIFSLLSLKISVLLTTSMKQVYHTIGILNKNQVIRAFFLLSFLSSTLWIHISWESRLFWLKLLLLFVMNLLAQFDMLIGRIPIYFLFVGVVLGLVIGIVTGEIIAHSIGGLSNLALGTLTYLTGQAYKKWILKPNNTVTVFGLGDVFASGTMGFLLGYPLGNLAVLLALILAVAWGLIQSIFSGQEFLRIRVKLGLSFYSATVLIVIIESLKNYSFRN